VKVGDMVEISPTGTPDRDISGIIIDSLVHDHGEQWWLVLRNDTCMVEKFHENWCEVISESR
jgi:hypothetical protein